MQPRVRDIEAYESRSLSERIQRTPTGRPGYDFRLATTP